MESRTIEGTWDEVARHAGKLAGRKVRLTVLDEAALSPTMLDSTLADLIREAEQLASTLPPAPPPDDAWGEGVVEKFRRQGFTL